MSRTRLVILFTLVNFFTCHSLAEQLIALAADQQYDYFIAGKLCRLVNQKHYQQLHCTAHPTQDIQASIDLLRQGKVQFALIPSDIQRDLYEGSNNFTHQGEYLTLRSVFSLYLQPVTILTRSQSKINQVKDLKGKRINIGKPGTSERRVMEGLLRAQNWNEHNFIRVFELNNTEQMEAICSGMLDMMVFVSVKPQLIIDKVQTQCAVKTIDVNQNFTIYQTLVTSSAVSDDTVYNFTEAVFSLATNIDSLTLGLDGLTAPVHLGAAEYFQEMGLSGRD